MCFVEISEEKCILPFPLAVENIKTATIETLCKLYHIINCMNHNRTDSKKQLFLHTALLIHYSYTLSFLVFRDSFNSTSDTIDNASEIS